MAPGQGIPNADSRRVGGWLERRAARFAFKWIYPVVVMWIGFWFTGVLYLASDGGILFPTVATGVYLTLMIIQDHIVSNEPRWT